MRPEPPPAGAYAADFNAILEAKLDLRKDRLKRLEPIVAESYLRYDLMSGQLENLPRRRWSLKSREALRHCYEGGGVNLTRVKNDFFVGLSAVAKSRCPYCMIRGPGSIDHFLPIDFYPEFSVLTLNWVYVCEGCNRRKGTHLVAAPRELLNPYFDGIPQNQPIIFAAVSIVAGAPTVSFQVPTPNPLLPNPALAPIAARQVAAFGLIKRFEQEASALLTSTIGAIVYEANGPHTQVSLNNALQARRANLVDDSVNSWERRVLEAMELCGDLLDYVNARIASRPPRQPLPPPHDLQVVLRAQAIAAAS